MFLKIQSHPCHPNGDHGVPTFAPFTASYISLASVSRSSTTTRIQCRQCIHSTAERAMFRVTVTGNGVLHVPRRARRKPRINPVAGRFDNGYMTLLTHPPAPSTHAPPPRSAPPYIGELTPHTLPPP